MLSAVYAALIAALSLLPTPSSGLSVPHLDKGVHLVTYAFMAWLLMRSIRTVPLIEVEYAWLAWLFATSYGMLIEVLQLMMPWRSADWWDIGANALGAALGVWVGKKLW